MAIVKVQYIVVALCCYTVIEDILASIRIPDDFDTASVSVSKILSDAGTHSALALRLKSFLKTTTWNKAWLAGVKRAQMVGYSHNILLAAVNESLDIVSGGDGNTVTVFRTGDGNAVITCGEDASTSFTYSSLGQRTTSFLLYNDSLFTLSHFTMYVLPSLTEDLIYMAFPDVSNGDSAEGSINFNNAYPRSHFWFTACTVMIGTADPQFVYTTKTVSPDSDQVFSFAFTYTVEMTDPTEALLNCSNYVSELKKTEKLPIPGSLNKVALNLKDPVQYYPGEADKNLMAFRKGTNIQVYLTYDGGTTGNYTVILNSPFDALYNYPDGMRSDDLTIMLANKGTFNISGSVGTQNANEEITFDLYWNKTLFRQPGIHVYDFCESCFELELLSDSATFIVGMDTHDYLNYQVKVTALSDAESPENVWIDWAVTGVSTVQEPKFESRVKTTSSSVFPAIIKSLVYNAKYPERTLVVSCNTPLGPYQLQGIIYFIHPVSTAKFLRYDDYVESNVETILEFELQAAEKYLRYTIDYGDNTTIEKNITIYTGPLSESHVYTDCGVKNLILNVYQMRDNGLDGNTGPIKAYTSITVLNPVKNLMLKINDKEQRHGDELFLKIPSVEMQIYLASIDVSNLPPLPSHVTCAVDYGDTNSDSYYAGDFSADSLVTFQHTYTKNQQTSLQMNVTCSNPLSKQEFILSILISEKLEDVVIDVTDGIYMQKLGEKFNFEISVKGDVNSSQVAVLYGDSMADMICLVNSSEINREYEYRDPGKYHVTAMAWDVTGVKSSNLTEILIVQRIIDDSMSFTYQGTQTVYYPSNATHVMSLSTRATVVPSAVTCNFTYSENKTESVIISNYTDWLVEIGDEVSRYDYSDYDPELLDSSMFVNISCRNLVSDIMQTHHVMLIRLVERLTIQVETSVTYLDVVENEEKMVTCLDSSPCFVPQTSVVFSVHSYYGLARTYQFWPQDSFPFDSNLSAPTENGYYTVEQQKNMSMYLGLITVSVVSTERVPVNPQFVRETIAETQVIVQQSVFASMPFFEILGPKIGALPSDTKKTFVFESNTTVDWDALNASISCVWLHPNDSEVRTFNPRLIPSDSVDMYLDVTDGVLQTVKVQCSNYVSKYNWTHEVTIIRRIVDLAIAPISDFGIYTETNSAFNITGLYGELNLTYKIYANNSLMHTETKTGHQDFAKSLALHPGTYDIYVIVTDEGGTIISDNITVIVEIPLMQLDSKETKLGTIPPGNMSFVLRGYGTEGFHPTNIICSWHLTGHPNFTVANIFDSVSIISTPDSVETLDINEISSSQVEVIMSVNVTLDGTLLSDVEYFAHVTCGNGISTKSVQIAYRMEELILGLYCDADKYVAKAPGIITVSTSRESGTNTYYKLEFKKSASLTLESGLLFTDDDLSEQSITELLETEGSYNVTCHAYNDAQQTFVMLSTHIEIQKAVSNVTFFPLNVIRDTLAFPNVVNISRTMAFVVNTSYQTDGFPLTTYFEITYGDGQRAVEKRASKAETSDPHYLYHDYDRDSVGQVEVKLRAFNNISEQTEGLILNLTLMEEISSCSFITDKTFAAPNETIKYITQCISGSHVSMYVNFGDYHYWNNSFTASQKMKQTDVINRSKLYRHSYVHTGNYTFFGYVSNLITEPWYTPRVILTIQNVLPELKLYHNGPILTPPGLMQFNLSTVDDLSYAASDVTCVFDYGDGFSDEFYYHPDMDFPVLDFHHKYSPNKGTIERSVNVSVMCSNKVSQNETSEAVEIIYNSVYLADLVNNHPVVLGEVFVWNLTFHNYGYDTCTLWTYTNISHTVLFGREDCKLQSSMTSYHEFIEVTTETDVITHTINASFGPIVEVSVLAENSISSDSITRLGLALERPCDRPRVYVGEEGSSPDNPRQIHFAESNTINGVAETKCSYRYSYIIDWVIFQYNATGFFTNKGSRLPLTFPSKADLNLTPRMLPLGLYVTEMKVTIKGLPLDVISYDIMYLEVIPTPLVVQIAGGIERLVSIEDNPLIIDGVTLSFDFDLNDASNKSGMSWRWVCLASSNKVPAMYNWTTNNALDSGDCSIPSLQQSPSPGTLSMNTVDLTPGDSYLFAVYISKPDGREGTYFQIVHIQSDMSLEITLECQINCREYINPDDNVRYLGKCKTCNTDDEVTFLWEYQVYNDLTGTFDSTVPPLDPYIITDGAETAIDFPPKTFSERKTYRVKLIGSTPSAAGSSTTELRINSAPRDGFCEAKSLHDGSDSSIKVSVKCQAWRDDEEEAMTEVNRKKRSTDNNNAPNLDFEISVIMNYLDIPAFMILGHGRSAESPATYLPVGNPASNGSVPIQISIVDSFGTAANTTITVQNELIENLTEKVLFNYMKDLRRTADAGDIQITTAMIWTMLSLQQTGFLPTELTATDDMVDELYSDEQLSRYPLECMNFSNAVTVSSVGDENSDLSGNTTTINTLSYYILQLSKLKPVFPNEIRQVTEQLAYLSDEFSSLSCDIDLATVVDILSDMTEPFESYCDQFTVNGKLNTMKDILRALGSALKVASQKSHAILLSYCSMDECPEGILEKINNTLKDMVIKAEDMIDALSDLSLQYSVPEEVPVLIDAGHIILSSRRIKRSSLPGYSVQTRLGGIGLPDKLSVYENVTSDDVDVLFWLYEVNPYVWDVSSYSLNGPTNQIKVKHRVSKQPQPLLDPGYDDPFKSNSVIQVQNTAEMLFIEMNDTSTDLALHTFWMNDTSLTAQLFFDVGSLRDVVLELYIGYDYEPNIIKYDFTTKLPKGLPEEIPSDRVERLALLSNATKNFSSNVFSFVLPKDVTKSIGLYTVAVFIIAHDDGGDLLSRANYTFYVQYTSCQLWFEEEDAWKDEDCEVSGETSFVVIFIVSRIFPTSFGHGLVVAPNTISFSKVFDDPLTKIRENWHVVLTVLFFFTLYLTLLPLAYRKDRIDVKNWTAFPVLGVPIPEGYHKYIVDVYTGFGAHNGTDSNVYISLAGDQSETQPIHLDTPERKNFAKGHLNRFLIGHRCDLGRLYFVNIWHNSKGIGDKSDWFLEKIVITNVQSNTRYLFLCEDWLSLNRGTCKTYRMLQLSSRDELLQVKRMFKKRARSLFVEDNLWVSTFMKREIDGFTRVQRLTAATAIVFLVMVSNAMWYGRGDSDNPKDGIQLGPFSFTLQSLMVSLYSVLTVVPVSLLIVVFFRKSKPRKDYSKQEERTDEGIVSQSTQTHPETPPPPYFVSEDMNTNNSNNIQQEYGLPNKHNNNKMSLGERFSGKILPFWCGYIAFGLCIASMMISAFFTISYSFEWGGEKSAQWLSAFLLCFLESEGLFSPLKAITLALIFAVLCKKPQDHSDEYLDEEESFYFQSDKEDNEEVLLERLEKLKYRKWLENTLREAFRKLIWQALLLISLALVVFGNADGNSFKVNENLLGTYFEPATEITSQADFWDYMRDTAVPEIFLEERYNKKKAPTEQHQFLANGYSKRLGAPGLRQFRVTESSCSKITELMPSIHCVDDYSRPKEEKKTFKEQWMLPTPNVTYIPTSVMQQAFQYDSGDTTNYIYSGYYKDYYGRGYSVPLGSNKAESDKLVKNLITSRWLDNRTRAVTLEFNVYNANINLFTLVSLLVEFPSFGGVLLKAEIKSVKLYRYIGGFGVFALIAEAIVCIFITILTVRIVYHVVKQGRKYFKNLFNLSEVLKVSCGIAAVITYTTRTIMIQSTVNRLLNNREEYANFRGIILVDELFLSFIGLTLFIQILQLLWVFKFNVSLAHLYGTLKYSMEDVAGILLAFFGLFLGFSILYYDTYGTLLWDYRTFLHTFYSNVSSILGHFKSAEYEEVAGLSGRILFIGFMVSSVFFYINMLISMITLAYADVKSGNLDIGQEHKVEDLISEKFTKKDDAEKPD